MIEIPQKSAYVRRTQVRHHLNLPSLRSLTFFPFPRTSVRTLTTSSLILVAGTLLAQQERTIATKPDPEGAKLFALCDLTVSNLVFGEPAFSRTNRLPTVRLPITNTSEETLDVKVHTRFVREDGSVVPNPYAQVKGGFEAISRGFVGLVSLGASEMSIQDKELECSMSTLHSLEPGQQIVVEHQLPVAHADVVGSECHVGQVTRVTSEAASAQTAANTCPLVQQYWNVRERYFRDRKQENDRWERLRSSLEGERRVLDPVSQAYKSAMEHYWKAHQSHKETLQSLETTFSNFVVEHQKRQKEKASTVTP